MAFRIVTLFLFLFAFLSLTATAQRRGPVVEKSSPQTVSANSVLELHGYRLYPSPPAEIKIYFYQNGNTYTTQTGGGSSVTNDEQNGRQTLEVFVPEEVVPGPTQVVVETNSVRSAPITVTIVEWKLPKLKSISPTRGSPGTDVLISSLDFTSTMKLNSRMQPRRPHVAVPTALSPGNVQLQTRTWRDGRPSVWSSEASFRLTERPVPPSVEGIRLEKGSWVNLWPGPDRAQSFSARAGDAIVLNGSFRVVDAPKLKVSLVGSAGSIELVAAELHPKAEAFGDVVVKLPETLARGDWRMLVGNADDGTQCEVPIVIQIK